MTEFLNYEVTLQFKDGTDTKGVISHVDGSSITLGNKNYPNVQIKDLKVNQLPADFAKEQKKKKKKPLEQIDDAIVSASKSTTRSGTPKPRDGVQPEWPSNVQDIKSSEDFDFAANLAMFDKASIFADFQKNDKVSSQDRLVGHNKKENVQKPKKQPSQNDKFDNDEMVIPAGKQDNWNNLGSSTKRLASPLEGSRANSIPSLLARDSFTAKPHKFIFSDNSTVPTASPVQLLEIERIAGTTFAYDQKSMIEATAINLYNLVVKEILGGAVRLSNRKNHNLPPLVLLLIGNGRSSSRAFALGRHLANHGVRVLAYVINDADLDDETRRESEVFEKFGGKCISAEFPVLLDILNNQLETPVELIIDALQGFEGHLLDMFYSEDNLTTLKELSRWANEPKQRSRVLSLDIPSGIDGGSGTVSDPELLFQSRYVVSLGLPISGLLHAYNNRSIGVGHDEVSHYVVDAGIPNALYNVRASVRKFDKFWYCAESYVRLGVAEQ
ncbi:hypothetical protein FT663_00571 [Candidozyma haemuli var. vulneris]|uniref:Enhancer of mRNA-decapping protein 3 n=1 Tax=Candidozyma haemuli TaxID=45357 RepID=A0A2V1B0U1_9ASCO|nr:hypothetical protein CXQ85_004045 [[Candida] haemuloni]KAF3993297.1 hypothetical protein FT662_00677 [[Candida] haemuloni var. vulneris]KAF3995353.1 hypothetical protein FT663_00571 [[Candida] haemuloni var. vulneris]PVH23752.1 hypothetical protein CXQ85_004045 [[Candida] haemuloni]